MPKRRANADSSINKTARYLQMVPSFLQFSLFLASRNGVKYVCRQRIIRKSLLDKCITLYYIVRHIGGDYGFVINAYTR